MKTFEPVKGFSFAPFVHAGLISTDEAKQSLLTMKERTASNFVILVPEALQAVFPGGIPFPIVDQVGAGDHKKDRNGKVKHAFDDIGGKPLCSRRVKLPEYAVRV